MEKERSQKTYPTKEDPHESYTKRMTSEPEYSENNLESGIENSDEEDAVFRNEEPLSTVMEDETPKTSPRQKQPREKAPRSHLQLHLDIKSASKRGMRIHGLDIGTPGSRGTPKRKYIYFYGPFLNELNLRHCLAHMSPRKKGHYALTQ